LGLPSDVIFARAVQLLVTLKGEGNIDWRFYAQAFGVFEQYRLSETLIKRASYKNWARSFLQIIEEVKGEIFAIDFIKYILKNELDFNNKKDIEQDRELLIELEMINESEEINKEKVSIDFGIITVKNCERDAINEVLNLEKRRDSDGFICFEGSVKHLKSGKEFNIIHYSGDQGNVEVSPFVSKLLKWNPNYIIMIGIAGGISSNKVKIGDVLVSEKIIYYSKMKLTDSKQERRPSEYKPDTLLWSNFRNFPSSKEEGKWVNNIKPEYRTELFNKLGKPIVHYGPIFSGELLVKSKNKVEELLDIDKKTIGFEQESAGVFEQTRYDIDRPRTISIRGTSDLADNPNSETWDDYHEYASNVVATYFHEFLKNGELEPKKKV